jgi:site-specific DNA-methyltransferase (adenine-specific)
MNPQVLAVLEGRARHALVHGDGFALARELGDGAVNLVLGDLPYDEKTHKGARTDKNGATAKIDIDFAPLPPVDTFGPDLVRCSKRWVLCFCAVEQLGEYRSVMGEAYIRGGLWVRTNGAPQKSGDRPAQGAEGIAIMHRSGRKRWRGGGKAATWTGQICDDPTREHPTKKPLWLIEALLNDFAEPEDIVFDPTMGEGTTGEACMRLGLRFIGCELKEKYHAMAVRRVERAESRGPARSLFAALPKAKTMSMFGSVKS